MEVDQRKWHLDFVIFSNRIKKKLKSNAEKMKYRLTVNAED